MNRLSLAKLGRFERGQETREDVNVGQKRMPPNDSDHDYSYDVDDHHHYHQGEGALGEAGDEERETPLVRRWQQGELLGRGAFGQVRE